MHNTATRVTAERALPAQGEDEDNAIKTKISLKWVQETFSNKMCSGGCILLALILDDCNLAIKAKNWILSDNYKANRSVKQNTNIGFWCCVLGYVKKAHQAKECI